MLRGWWEASEIISEAWTDKHPHSYDSNGLALTPVASVDHAANVQAFLTKLLLMLGFYAIMYRLLH